MQTPDFLSAIGKLEEAIDDFIENTKTLSPGSVQQLKHLAEFLMMLKMAIQKKDKGIEDLAAEVEQLQDPDDWICNTIDEKRPLEIIEDRVVAMGQPVLEVLDQVMRENGIHIEPQYLEGATA